MNRIMYYTKEVCEAFKEVNGKMKIDMTSRLGRMKLDDRRLAFLSRYDNFVLHSGVVSEVTRIYLNSVESNPHEAVRVYNERRGELGKFKSKKVSNHLYYDTKRLLEFFDDDMLPNVIHKKDDITLYEGMLEAAINKKMGLNKLQENCVLKLDSGVSNEVPSEDAINNFFMLYAPYTKKMVGRVTEQIPVNVVRYFNYILNKRGLSDDERLLIQRLQMLDEDYEIE